MNRLLATASVLAFGATPALAQQIFDLGEIVVTATAAPTEIGRTGQSIEVLDGESLSASGDIGFLNQLERLPGVSITQNGPLGMNADIVVRGNKGRYIPVYIDGILASDPSSTSGAFSDFGGLTAGGLRRVELLKGSQSALYGGSAVGGVLNVSTLADTETADGLRQSAQIVAGSYGSVAADYLLSHRVGATAVSFGVSHAQSDGFSAAEETAGNPEADSFRRSRVSFGIQHDIGDNATIGFNGFVEDGRNDFDEFGATPQDGTPDEVGTNKALGLRGWGRFVTGGVTHDVSVQKYRVKRTQDSPTTLGFTAPFSSRFEADRLRFEYRATGDVTDTLKLSGGLDYQRETADYANLVTGSEKLTSKGAFVEAVFAPNDDLDVTATVRLDDHDTFGRETTGRLAFSWRPVNGTVLRGAIASGYRPPAIDELYGTYPGAFPFFGNPALQPETSRSFELGIDQFFDNGARLSATAFRTDIDDLITYQFGIPASTLVNVPGESTRQGIELGGAVPVSDAVTLFGNYTYLDAKSATGTQLGDTARHDLLIGIEAQFSDSLSGALTARHVADLVNFGTAMPDYTVVNATMDYRLSDTSKLFLRVDNLLDEQYQTANGYGTSDRALYVGIRADF